MLSTENTQYGRARSIMMAKGGVDMDAWNPALYDIDEEEDTSTEGEEDQLLALKQAASDPTVPTSYLSIDAIPQENTTNGHHGRTQRRYSTAQDAWASIYGVNNGGRVSPRRHSLFHFDSRRGGLDGSGNE